MEISLTEENYIKAIFSINYNNHGSGVTTNELSEHLNNKAGSVTDMLKRLSEKKLINYQKYKSVFLTTKGEKLAINIVRKHRLWEVFLMEKLKFRWDEVHDIAEQLEHIKSEDLITRLDDFLGKPRFDPHGDPIPDSNGHWNQVKTKPLSNYKTKGQFIFMGVAEHSKSFLQHLTSIGLKIGDTIKIEEINEFDNSFKVRINKNESQYFSDKVSSNILVEIKKMNKSSKSLGEVNSSVNTHTGSTFRRLLAFFGPAYMISVGYMDPGNWATDIAGGSKFGYSLLWVLIMSNLIALLLQSHCVKLGVVAGKDLAQASRENYPRFVNFFLYLLAEIAIAACDLAEVIGMAIGLHLLFPGISILMGVCITVFDSFILLFLLNKGIRKLEAFIISLVALIGVSFFVELWIAKPAIAEIATGFIPFLENDEALYIAIGIIGATVMPHNLYLHSSLVQTRSFKRNPVEIKKAIRFNIVDSAVALNLALFVNAAILILAATTFFKNGKHDVVEIQDAHQLLSPMLGSTLAPILFAVALIAAGQSSTITGTLAGQVVMEGYLNLRLRPWIRRILTRLIAIVPALITISIMGDSATGKLLIFSQVILSLQLGFAIIPLIHFVSDRSKMGDFVIPAWQKILSWAAALIIISLNIKLVYNEISDLIINSSMPILVSFTLVPICVFCFLMLLYILIIPTITKERFHESKGFHDAFKTLTLDFNSTLNRIAVTVDFGTSDNKAINKAIQLGNKNSTLILIHVLESTNAVVYGEDAFDLEREEDFQKLKQYQDQLTAQNIKTEIQLGFGNPKYAIPELIIKNKCDTVVMGTHGHQTVKDFLLGSTIENVRHSIKVPLVLV